MSTAQLPLLTDVTVKVPADVGGPSVAAGHGAVNAAERFDAGTVPPPAFVVVTLTVAVSLEPVKAIGGDICGLRTKEPA